MRCPKCAYISFDAGDRCRNCGYNFSLAGDGPQPPESTVRETAEGPFTDLVLPGTQKTKDTSKVDLPLFREQRSGDDEPLVQAPTAQRPPLSVRRQTPEIIKARPEVDVPRQVAPTLDLEPTRPRHPKPTGVFEPDPVWEAATLGRRLIAGLIDLSVLALVGAIVLHFTLRLTELSPQQVGELPFGPLAAFFLFVYGGYFLAFTVAGGQTIGKMAAHIRVVGADSAQVSTRAALARTAACTLSLLPIGLGYFAALRNAKRRAWHDRLSATRVVKIS